MQREELPSAEFYDAIRARRRRIACARCFIAPKPFNVFDAEMSNPHACCQAGGITVEQVRRVDIPLSCKR